MPSEPHAYNAWWAEPGDRVKVDEPIAQIETDKVTALRFFFCSSYISYKLMDLVFPKYRE